jgi:16S rRNA (guanine1207-N2)-methyltransferase
MSQYFSKQPGVASSTRTVQLKVAPGKTVELTTDRGVFAHDAIDPGTQILLNTVPDPPAGDLLDLGCGYGPIAIWLAHHSPASTIWAIDSNERAVGLASSNAERLGYRQVHASLPEAVPPEVQFTAIYSNPPIRIGKEPLHTLLMDWLGRLLPQGVAYLVVQRHLGSDSLATWLESQRFSVERIRSQQAYRVLRVTKG